MLGRLDPTRELCGSCGVRVHNPNAPAFLMECHYCGRWFHGSCVGLTEFAAIDIAKFACQECEHQGHATQRVSPITQRDQLQQLSYAPLPIQRGFHMQPNYDNAVPPLAEYRKNSSMFRQLLNSAIFAKSGIRHVNVAEFNAKYFQTRRFDDPILLIEKNWVAAGKTQQFPVISSDHITQILDDNVKVCSFDVDLQEIFNLSTNGWELRQHGDNTSQPPNAVFQLEDSSFYDQVAAPDAVREVDWYHMLMKSESSSNTQSRYRQGQYGAHYGACTFVDFSIARSQSSIWLSVSSGEIWFLLVPPTPDNLREYKHWVTNMDPPASRSFLGDQVDKCIKCVVCEGMTILVPAGWIYALYSPVESSFFCGAFSTTLSLTSNVQTFMLEADPVLRQAWFDKSFGYMMQDMKAQMWAMLYEYIHLLTDQTGTKRVVTEVEKQSLAMAIPNLRQFSSMPIALDVQNRERYVPTSIPEAQHLIEQLNQAVAGASPTYNPNASGPNVFNVPLKMQGHMQQEKLQPNFQSTWPATGNQMEAHSMQQMWDYDPRSVHQDASFSGNNTFVPDFDPGYDSRMNMQLDYALQSFSMMHQSPPVYPTNVNGQVHPNYMQQNFGPGMTSAPPVNVEADTSYQMNVDQWKMYQNGARSHRASCHRCGNLRKKNTQCSRCPHIFCHKCAEKMMEEHEDSVFVDGCPVCKELCCCGKNRTDMCQRKYHCYKKCPSTKRPTT